MILKLFNNIFGKKKEEVTTSSLSTTPDSQETSTNSPVETEAMPSNSNNENIETSNKTDAGQPVDLDKLSPSEQFSYIKEKAEQGEVLYMTDLGIYYLEGIGTVKDLEKGLYWTNKAAEAEDRMALHNLGCFYKDGQHVSQDLEKAKFFFQKASELKFGRSTNMLGVLAEKGIGMPQNYQTAKTFYEQAIEQEEWLAYENLAYFYLNGFGVEKDVFYAAELFNKAAEKNSLTEKGNNAFNFLLMKMYCKGVEFFNQGNLAESRKFIGISSIYNYTTSTKFLLLNLYDGQLLTMQEEHNVTRPFIFPQIDYIEKSIINIRSANSITRIQETEKGALNNEPDELCYAALYVLFGVESFGGWNHIELLKRSIEKGFVTALFWLGYCYEKGLGVDKNESIAESCYMKVIENGHPEPLWIKKAFKGDADRELAESYYRIALIRYNSGKYKPKEIGSILSYKYNECDFHSQSLMLIAKCLIKEGKTLDDKDLMDIVSICAKYKNDEAIYMLSQYYDSKNDEHNAFKYCIDALQLGNLDAVKMFMDKSKEN